MGMKTWESEAGKSGEKGDGNENMRKWSREDCRCLRRTQGPQAGSPQMFCLKLYFYQFEISC